MKLSADAKFRTSELVDSLYRRFGTRILSLARRRLPARLRSKLDPDDILQSVVRRFLEARSPQDVASTESGYWPLLATMTNHQCINRTEYFYALRRDIRREYSFESGYPLGKPIDTESPSLQAVHQETLEQLLAGFRDQERIMIRLHVDGFSVVEISQRVERAERTVRRVLARFRERASAHGLLGT